MTLPALQDIEAVVFDFDGVIASTLNGDPFRRLGEARSSSDPPFMRQIYALLDSGRHFTADWAADLKKAGIDLTPRMKAEISSRMFHISMRDWIAYSWVGQVIPILSERTRLAVCSNNSRKNVKFVLGRLIRHFSCVVTRENVDRLKPNPEGMLRACRDIKVRPASALIIGDSIIDEMLALATGSYVGIATWAKEQPRTRFAWVNKRTFTFSEPELLLELIPERKGT